MKKFILLAVILGIAALSCAATDINWHPRNVTFANTTVVGGTPLPAGEYKVEHVMKGEEHVMVFTNIYDKKVKAESKCHMLKTDEKARQTEQAVSTDGKNTLKRLIFKGDVYVHELYQ